MGKRIKLSGVYQIRNKENGKVYVGSTVDFGHRWNGHVNSLQKGTHHSRHLQAAWNKYGITLFEFEILEVTEAADLAVREQSWLNKTCAYLSEFGYNVCPLVESRLGAIGKPLSEETKARMSATRRGRPLSEKHKDSIRRGHMGHEVSAITRLKLREAFLGKPHTEETKAKMRKSHQGRPSRKCSEATKIKIRASLLARSAAKGAEQC